MEGQLVSKTNGIPGLSQQEMNTTGIPLTPHLHNILWLYRLCAQIKTKILPFSVTYIKVHHIDEVFHFHTTRLLIDFGFVLVSCLFLHIL